MKTSHKLAFGFLILCIGIVLFRLVGHNSSQTDTQTQQVVQGVQTTPPGAFPGTGSEKDWQEARAIAHESANAFRANDFNRAVELGQQAISKYPNDADILDNTGLAYVRRNGQGDGLAGEALIRQALALRPNNCLYLMNLSQAYVAQNKVQEAKQALSLALQANPSPEQAAAIAETMKALDGVGQAPQQ